MSKNKIFVECHEANHYCDKNQYKEATLWEKVKLNIHLIYCRACRKYSANNNKLTKLINKPEVHSIADDQKQAMKDLLSQELSK
ncbi:hypothetical protein [Aquimarina rhabdastrellae]